MNWRWIVPAVLALAIIDGVSGLAAYHSATWNFSHTEVLYGWDGVRYVSLVMVPTFIGGILAAVWLVLAAVMWASRGGR